MTTFVYRSDGEIVERYELPEGVDVEIDVFESHGVTHVDFNFTRDGEHIPILGGTDGQGNRVPGWKEVGIRSVD